MADKRISDLDLTTDLQPDTLFHVRKPASNEDLKITKASLVESIGNPAVNGFVATSPSINRLVLNSCNTSVISSYIQGMKISFISPINSTDLVKIKIGSLGYIDFKTTFTNPISGLVENAVLKNGKFYEAIYSNNSFIQTNIDRQYTNEYLSYGEVFTDPEVLPYTHYNLTSATGYYKTSYYEGMSIVFTSGILLNSIENITQGKIYINVDGLGYKELSDPDGDGVPFTLQPNETIMGIYDGEKFIKNMFTMQEPELPVPVDPDNPPPGYNVIIYVGPDEPEVSNRLLQTAYDRIVKDYGIDGGGRKVLIKFRDNYTGEGLRIRHVYAIGNYITIEGNENVIMLPIGGYPPHYSCILVYNSGNEVGCNLNITGTWKMNFPITDTTFKNNYSFFAVQSNKHIPVQVFLKNAKLINLNQGNQNYTCFYLNPTASANITIEDCEFINFGQMFSNDDPSYIVISARNIKITNTISVTRSFQSILALSNCRAIIINLILNITKQSNYTSLIYYMHGNVSISDTNIEISEPLNGYLIKVYQYTASSYISINNSIIKYADNVINTKGSIEFSSAGNFGFSSGIAYLNGNNYVNASSLTVPDILVDRYTLYLKSGTLGSTSAINGGSIVNV